MPWRINESEVELRGAIQVLSACTNSKPVQLALQFLKSEHSISYAASTLAHALAGQEKHIQDLEYQLARCRFDKQQSDSLVESFRRDLGPNYKRVQELESQIQQAEKERTAAAVLRSTLEREQRFQAEEISRLEAELSAQQSVIARQHLKLQELLGEDTQ
jgi:bacterioferritin (cytochrome b1)